MQPFYYVMRRVFGGEISQMERTEKESHVRHGTGIALFAQLPNRQPNFYEPVLDHRKGADIDGRQRIQPIDAMSMYCNLDRHHFSGIGYLHMILGTHTGRIRFQPSPIDDANTLRYYLQMAPNEILIRSKSDDYREIQQMCEQVMAFRDDHDPRKQGRRLAAQFHAARNPGQQLGWSKAQHAAGISSRKNTISP